MYNMMLSSEISPTMFSHLQPCITTNDGGITIDIHLRTTEGKN